MRTRRLEKRSTQVLTLEVRANEAIILFVCSSGSPACYLASPESGPPEFDAPQSGDITEVKFLGSSQLFYELVDSKFPWLQKISKAVSTADDFQIVYDQKSGQLKIPKNFIGSEIHVPKERFTQEPADIQSPKKEDGQAKPEQPGKKKVLIVDDSRTIQKLIRKIVESSNILEVVGVASRPSEARELIKSTNPDLITLDIHMPEMNGVEFLKKEVSKTNIPVVMVTSVSKAEGPLVVEALSAGAVAYIQKPTSADILSIQDELIEKLEEVANSKVVEQTKSVFVGQQFLDTKGLIAIGSSTGGTRALEYIFTCLPAKIPPIIVTQHIPASFSKALATHLDRLCPFTVKELEGEELLNPDTVYIAPGSLHMNVEKTSRGLRIETSDEPAVGRFKPSVEYMFKAIARCNNGGFHGPVVAIMLTGMGKDGATAMAKLREQGVGTIGQDEASCVVYGMPKAAKEAGAIEHEVALDDIPSKIVSVYNQLAKKKRREE